MLASGASPNARRLRSSPSGPQRPPSGGKALSYGGVDKITREGGIVIQPPPLAGSARMEQRTRRSAPDRRVRGSARSQHRHECDVPEPPATRNNGPPIRFPDEETADRAAQLEPVSDA
jgi:hypothetical protein